MQQFISNHSLEALGRRKVYLYALPAGIVTLVLGMIANYMGIIHNDFDRIAQPLFAAFLGILWYFIQQRKFLIRTEFLLLSGLYLYFNAGLTYALSYPENINVSGEIGAFGIWSIGIYTMTFWLFGATLGKRIATYYFIGTLLFSLSSYIPSLLNQKGVAELYYVIQLYAGTIMMIIINSVYAISLEQRKFVAQAMQVKASTDMLTQLYNRQYLEEQLAQLMQQPQDMTFSVVLLDIDHFKKVNDRFGHAVGDTVLKQISKLLKLSVRTSDIVGRWGGEEFIILLPHTPADRAEPVMERLRRSVASFCFEQVNSITISLGVTQYQPGDTLNELLERADQALYYAKDHGRNQIKVTLVPIG